MCSRVDSSLSSEHPVNDLCMGIHAAIEGCVQPCKSAGRGIAVRGVDMRQRIPNANTRRRTSRTWPFQHAANNASPRDAMPLVTELLTRSV
jgi:hypothetical protein